MSKTAAATTQPLPCHSQTQAILSQRPLTVRELIQNTQNSVEVVTQTAEANGPTRLTPPPYMMALPADLNDKLAELRIVFCDLTVDSLEDLKLTYIFCADPVNFSKIKVFSPMAEKLSHHIQRHYFEIYSKKS